MILKPNPKKKPSKPWNLNPKALNLNLNPLDPESVADTVDDRNPALPLIRKVP